MHTTPNPFYLRILDYGLYFHFKNHYFKLCLKESWHFLFFSEWSGKCYINSSEKKKIGKQDPL